MTGLGAAMAGGNALELGRQDDDYYPTPGNVTKALLRAWHPRSGIVWEAACGCGMMAREIEAAGLSVIATDIADRGYGILKSISSRPKSGRIA
jgi:predicted RNA methylase